MAIHVRSTRGASRQWKLLRKMFFRMSAIVAVAAVLLSALVLYLVRIFSPVPPVSEFVAYMESGEKMEEEASSPSSSYDAVRQVNVQVQPVIVTTAPVDVSLAEVDIVLDADLLAEEDFSLETGMTTGDLGTGGGGGDGRDSYFMEAAKIIIDKEKASIGMLQRYLKVGFNRAARIMDQLEEAGIVGPEEGTKPRKVLMSPEEFENFIEEGY